MAVTLAAAGPLTPRRRGAWLGRYPVRSQHLHALVVLDGLAPGSDDAYEVLLDGVPVWPHPGMPPSQIRTLDPTREPRFAFGTCRATGSHDDTGNRDHDVDHPTLRTVYAARIAALPAPLRSVKGLSKV